MRQMREDDTKAYRTPQEINELTMLLENDTIQEDLTKRAKVLIQMNIRDNTDGTHVPYKKRLEETMSSLKVSKAYVRETLTLYNRAGINGIMRLNCEVKPDIADRKEDRLLPDIQSNVVETGIDFTMEKMIEKMSERTGIDSHTLQDLMNVMEEYGIRAVMDNPAKMKRLWAGGEKQAEVAGFWFGAGTGIFSIATKNIEVGNGTFIIRNVFKNTVACNESKDAVESVFKEDDFAADSPECFSRQISLFFSELRQAYPPEDGWRVHSFILDERAATDSITSEPIIEGLPSIDGYSFEKTVHLCEFTSPIKAAFEMAYRRDDTNVQGWKVRDKVAALIRATEFSKPVVYIGAKTEIVDRSVPNIQMYACVNLPGNRTLFIRTPARELPFYDEMGADVVEEYKDALSQADYMVKDMATELAGSVFQGTANAAQADAAGDGILKPILAEAESGRKRIKVRTSIAESLGAKKMLYTNCFMDLAGDKVTEESFRITADGLNRTLHRKGYEEIHYTTLQDMVTKEGTQILECLKSECEEGLELYQVEFRDGKPDFSHIPKSAANPTIMTQAASAYDWKAIDRNLKKRNEGRDESDQLTLEQVKEALSHMEKDPKKTVYVIFDGVVVKMQKEHRTRVRFQGFKSKTLRRGGKKRGRKKKTDAKGQSPAVTEDNPATFQTHDTYILFQNKAYVMEAASMEEACENALGFLLKMGLLEDHELVFFSDGANDIKTTISRYFSFRHYSLYLDWHHVEQCLYQYFTMFLKGGKDRLEENERIRQGFFNLLWEGKFEEAKEYIRNIDKTIVKSPQAGESILNYLKRKADYLYTFEIRKLAGLINSSNRVEQINHKLVSKRQKKNGMAWCPTGSRALTAWSMMYINNGWATWHKTRKVSFEMHETKVPDIYILPGEAQAA